ncbi:MAG TPA: YlxR family protein [Nocardioides sp.]|uniref:YlxR family protein n=1 Tax=Nocardioides sp. TaxID=35761 RepID=UPI002ED9D8B5
MARQDETPAHGPIRTCVGCRQRAAKRELLRVTAGTDANGQPAVVPDPTGTAPGRGAHLHPTPDCYDLAVRRKAFTRALRLEGGRSAAPVGEYVAARPAVNPLDQTRNWSNSS